MSKSRPRRSRIAKAVLFDKFARGKSGGPAFLAPASPVPKPSMNRRTADVLTSITRSPSR